MRNSLIFQLVAVVAAMQVFVGCDSGVSKVEPPAAEAPELAFERHLGEAMECVRGGRVLEAQKACDEALALMPDSAEAQLVSGQAAYLRKDYAAALRAFEAVAHDKTLSPELRSEAYSSIGVVQYARNELDRARIAFIRAQRFNPRNASAWYHQGMISRDVFKYNQLAKDQLEYAKRLLDPNDSRAIKLGASIIPALVRKLDLARPARKPDGEAVARKLVVDGDALVKKHLASPRRNKLEPAVKKYADAMAADPCSDEAALKYAETLLKLSASAANVDKALLAYNKALNINPYSQKGYLAAGQLAFKNGKWSQAESIMNRAIAYDPTRTDTLDIFIGALRKAGKHSEEKIWDEYRASIRK